MKIILGLIISSCLVTPAFAQYPRDQKIAGAEYFLNVDPGEGNGVAISANYGYWEIPIEVIIDAPIGTKIYVRAKSTNGTWSGPRCIQRKETFTNSGATLQYGEYYINTDPGKGNGTALDFSNGTALISNLKLKRGDKIYTRVKDNLNRWSQSRAVKFTYLDMHKAEYSIKRAGVNLPWESMILNPGNDSSCIFSAYKNDIPIQFNDSIVVRFQRKDGFGRSSGPISDVENQIDGLPKEFNLSQNYPNPFNPATIIKYALPNAENVSIRVYDILGREVAVLVDEYKSAGYYSTSFDAVQFASGVYMYRIQAGSFVSAKKMMVIK